MVAGPACSLGSLPPGLMALAEGGSPLSCQSGGAPQSSPGWSKEGGPALELGCQGLHRDEAGEARLTARPPN